MTSSAENIPASRPSMSDASQLGPIGLFDYHLRFLSDSYLSFFLERAKIEETYVESLLRLHKKVKTIDTFLDDRTEPTSVRQAWNEVRDNVEREAQTRQAFLGTLTVDVINPLLLLKETQERTKKRIKEDIRESTIAHMEYAENGLPRLKRNYLKKCQEVDEHKAAAVPSTPAQSSHSSQDPLSLTASRSHPTPASPPVVTSPQPLRPLTRRPSGHQQQPRNRSPSTSNPLQDLAHSGKRQLNQLMTFLDNKGGTMKEGLGSGRSDAAIRSVRSKREADEADKEYRKGVHWLETLRLRRVKILEGGFKSLELFIEESAGTLKKVLEQFADNATATSTTQTHLSMHVRSVVNRISPQRDVSALSSSIPRYLLQSTPRRTLYTNYLIGDCSDLMFGVGLVDYANARGLHEGDIPKLIRICIHEVDKRGLNSEGIYRVSGRHAVVQELMHKIEKDERNFQFNPSTDDVFVVASLLKQYLRELPEPVFKFPLEDRVKHTEDLEQHVANNFPFLRGKIRRLPVIHQVTLKVIVEHLARVAAHSEKNKMDPKNLAIIFGGVIFGEDEMPKNGDLLAMHNWKDSLMEDIIVHAGVLFDERGPSSPEPPLPAAPAGEPLPSYGYGSAYTQVATMPPRRSTEQQSAPDFTPQLPPRPGNSIHPSRRANAQSSKNAATEGEDYSQPHAPRPAESASREATSFDSDSTIIPLDDDSNLRRRSRTVEEAPAWAEETQHWDSAKGSETFVSAQPTPDSPRVPRTPKSATTTLAESAIDPPEVITATPSRRSHDLVPPPASPR